MNPSDSTSEADLLTKWSRMVSSLRDTPPQIADFRAVQTPPPAAQSTVTKRR